MAAKKAASQYIHISMHLGEFTIVVLSGLLAPLGCISLWRRATYLCDGISHAGVLASVIADSMLWGVVPFSTFFSIGLVLLIRWLERSSDMYVATNIASTTSIAAAILLRHFFPSGGQLSSLMFGCNCCSHLHSGSMVPLASVCVLSIGFIVLFFKQIVLIAFNRDLAAVAGVNVTAVDIAFLIATSAAINLAMLSVGFLLVGALLILPAVASQFFARTPLAALVSSSALGILNSLAGTILAAKLHLPTASMVALVSFVTFLASYSFARFSQKVY